jgi:methionyl-tRNA formyltransferase
MNNIMFMGTPEISATCLARLIEDGHGISVVITREDKPRGRGKQMMPTQVKVLAEENGIDVYTPATLRDDAFAALLDQYKPEMIVVVAYGKILPLNVIEYPKYGCINLHVSLLPKYRGAAPMQRAIMEG